MHTWWTGDWNGTDPITPPRVHQQNLHRRRARRQERAGYQPVVNSSDDEPEASADIQITSSPNRQEVRKQTPRVEARHTSLLKRSTGEVAAPRRTDDTRTATAGQSSAATRHKRSIQDLDVEAAADRAATEIVDLVDQELLSSTTRDRKGVDESVDRDNRGHGIANTQVDRTEVAGQDDDGIPVWVITESKAISREVTPPEHLFFSRSRGTSRRGLWAGSSHWHAILYVLQDRDQKGSILISSHLC